MDRRPKNSRNDKSTTDEEGDESSDGEFAFVSIAKKLR